MAHKIFAATGIYVALALSPALATTITFDIVADGTVIDTAFAAQGVTFDNPIGGSIYARAVATSASPPNVVSVLQTGFPAFDARSGAVEAVFAAPQSHVSIDAAIVRAPEGLGTPQNAPKLEIYDTLGALLTTVSWDFATIPQPPAGGITGYETLAFNSGASDIGKVRFFSSQPGGSPSNFGLFDNLVFSETTTVPIPEPTSLVCLGLGLGGLAAARRLRRVRASG